MVGILQPELSVERVPDRPGERCLVVSYELDIAQDDPAIGHVVREEVVVEPRDEHDAPVRPQPVAFRFVDEVTVTEPGTIDRRLEKEVHRVDLDVEQDWWDTDLAGGTEPIAEFADHLDATLTLRVGGIEIARRMTPVVTGSWGALGTD